MKNCFRQIILFTFLCVCTSCKSKEAKCQFTAKPIVKTVGKIDVMVDPNVEMMMILGRLGNVVPFGKNEWNKHEYLDRVDEFFKEYTNHNGVLLISNNMAYHRIPEFGMPIAEVFITGIAPKAVANSVSSAAPVGVHSSPTMLPL